MTHPLPNPFETHKLRYHPMNVHERKRDLEGNRLGQEFRGEYEAERKRAAADRELYLPHVIAEFQRRAEDQKARLDAAQQALDAAKATEADAVHAVTTSGGAERTMTPAALTALDEAQSAALIAELAYEAVRREYERTFGMLRVLVDLANPLPKWPTR